MGVLASVLVAVAGAAVLVSAVMLIRHEPRRQLKRRTGANGLPCADSPSAATLRQTSGQKLGVPASLRSLDAR
jgi:hypothetical protein